MPTILTAEELKELVELALDHELPDFDMDANLYEVYGFDSMAAVALFVELQLRTGVEASVEVAPLLQTGTQIARVVEERTAGIKS
jgi:acyl carrier protein